MTKVSKAAAHLTVRRYLLCAFAVSLPGCTTDGRAKPILVSPALHHELRVLALKKYREQKSDPNPATRDLERSAYLYDTSKGRKIKETMGYYTGDPAVPQLVHTPRTDGGDRYVGNAHSHGGGSIVSESDVLHALRGGAPVYVARGFDRVDAYYPDGDSNVRQAAVLDIETHSDPWHPNYRRGGQLKVNVR